MNNQEILRNHCPIHSGSHENSRNVLEVCFLCHRIKKKGFICLGLHLSQTLKVLCFQILSFKNVVALHIDLLIFMLRQLNLAEEKITEMNDTGQKVEVEGSPTPEIEEDDMDCHKEMGCRATQPSDPLLIQHRQKLASD